MSATDQPLPAGGSTREELAKMEMARTSVTPGLARALVTAFLVAIASVPIIEVRVEGQGRTWSLFADLPQSIGRRISEAAARRDTLWRKIVVANREVLSRLSSFENALEDESILGRTLRRPAQRVMAAWLGTGNERVYIGRDGWLFYRPDVEYITGQPFLHPAHARRRIAAAAEWTAPPQPDPRKAILQFHQDLQSRGITLIVMPTPMKPGVHPEMLSRRAEGVLQNQSFPAFVDDLRRAGVVVFDPAGRLATLRSGNPQYLKTDTHWLPETMEAVAEQLAALIEQQVTMPVVPDPAYRVERIEVRSTGDTARMLDLTDGGRLFPPESVWLRRVLLPDGSPWRSSRTADVLLLGDSYSNIYSLESMAWGTSAGFAEQLSFVLRRPVDRLVQNDEGAFATRAMLERDQERLNGKRVVVYQFAARELMFGDWKVLQLSSQRGR